MKIKIILPMNKLPKHNILAIKEYSKRLTRYCKLELIKTKNFDEALKKLPKTDLIIGVTSDTTTITSEDLASRISSLGVSGTSNICFILLPNSTSLRDSFVQEINNKNITYEEIALSKMSISLDLSCVILHEQIYRAYRIINNQAYHK